jgi:hypothetical protein
VRQDRVLAEQHQRGIGRRARLYGARAVTALVIGTAGSAIIGAPVQGAEPPGIRVVGRLHAFSNVPTVNSAVSILDIKARTLYAFSQPRSSVAPLSVRAWDVDRMKPLSPQFTGVPVQPIGPSTPLAVDEQNHVVVVAPSVADGSLPTAIVLGLRDGQIKVLGTITTRFPVGYQIAGITVDAARGRAIVIAAPAVSSHDQRQGISPAAGTTQIDTWKLADVARGVLASELTTAISVPSACGQPMTTVFPAGAIVTPDGKNVYIGCVGNRGLLTPAGPNAGDAAGVGRVTLPTGTAATAGFLLFPVAGSFNAGDSVAASGTGRMVLTTASAGQTNMKVFDVAHEHYVGNVGVNALGVSGIVNDPINGRGYMVAEGLRIFELDPTPVTQGHLLPQFNEYIGAGGMTVVFDPKTRRLFVPTADDVVHGNDPYLLVFKDTGPAFDVDKAADPDAGAADVAEVPGVADSDRANNIAGIGAEFRLVGGTSNLILNVAHADTRQLAHAGTRYAQLGVVRGVRLTNNEASAEAITARHDDTTQGEITTTLAEPVTCGDFGETPGGKSADSVQVSCDLAKQKVTAYSAMSSARVLLAKTPLPTPEPVQIQSAASSTVTERDPATGITKTTVTSEADGISILGTVTIGRVVATATTETHGRPGTAKSNYKREFSDVVIAGQRVCNAACSADAVIAQINNALAGRANVTYPDTAIFASRGGTTAEVSTDAFQHTEDVLLNEEPDESVVSPAMLITVYTDGAAQSRLLVRLAAVSSTQKYRIFKVPGDPDGPSGPPVTPTTGPPGTPGSPGSTITLPGSKASQGGTVTGTAPTGSGPTGVLGGIFNGLRVVFRSPGQIAGIACVWMLLALPAYLSARRRLLLELPRLRRVQEDV